LKIIDARFTSVTERRDRALAWNPGKRMAIIVDFPVGGSFDDAATDAMGGAYELAAQLRPDVAKETLAQPIIAIARLGERDVEQLCTRALSGLEPSPLPSSIANPDNGPAT